MTNYLFTPAPVVSAPIKGTDKEYPIKRIFCVGRNYEAHAAEMGHKADKAEPFYFNKTPSTYVPSGAKLAYPLETNNYHFEMELVVAIGEDAFQVSQADAHSKVYGYCCGLDMTRRDLQLVAREKGRPWDLGKDFEESCVLSEIVPASDCGYLTTGTIELAVNGETKQKADLSELINNVAEVIEHLSRFYHLSAGDIIMTGTPAGVGPVVSGDEITGSIEGLGDINLTIV
jgi:fumarylpyruvate hydrolase